MTSFITTMLVPESPSLASHVSPPKPLEPVFTPGEPSPCIRRPSSSSIRSLYEAASCTSPSSTIKERDNLGQKRPTSPVKQFLNKLIYGNKQPPSSSKISEPQRINNTTHDTSLLRKSNTVDDFLSSNSRTRAGAPFKPKNASRGTTSWQLKQFAEATLGSGSLRKAVKLPEGEDENEWLAVNGKSGCPSFLEHSHVFTRANIPFAHSGRFLQSNQSTLWQHHRVLLTTKLSRNESDRRV